mmetsp:Transcript_16424/g.46687  ORF Transcript_16424/g.46687 Transcript_16424/m.46687 type:complete len:384 (-) Transcript_16424:47-1198(-)
MQYLTAAAEWFSSFDEQNSGQQPGTARSGRRDLGLCAGACSRPRLAVRAGGRPHRLGQDRRNVPHARKHDRRPVGKALDVAFASYAAEHEDGVYAGLDSGLDVRVHPVADHDGALAIRLEPCQGAAHHQRVGLADIVAWKARGCLDRQGERAGPGEHLRANTVRDVFVGPNEPRTAANELDSQLDVAEVVEVRARALADHDKVRRGHLGRVLVHDNRAFGLELLRKARLADDVRARPALLALEEGRGRHGARVKVALVRLEAELGEFLDELARRLVARVGEEQVALVGAFEELDKGFGSGKEPIAMVEHAVTVDDHAVLATEQVARELHIRDAEVARVADGRGAVAQAQVAARRARPRRRRHSRARCHTAQHAVCPRARSLSR